MPSRKGPLLPRWPWPPSVAGRPNLRKQLCGEEMSSPLPFWDDLSRGNLDMSNCKKQVTSICRGIFTKNASPEVANTIHDMIPVDDFKWVLWWDSGQACQLPPCSRLRIDDVSCIEDMVCSGNSSAPDVIGNIQIKACRTEEELRSGSWFFNRITQSQTTGTMNSSLLKASWVFL